MSSRGRATGVAWFIMSMVVAAVEVFNKIQGVRDGAQWRATILILMG